VFEKYYGFDHFFTAQSISNLGFYWAQAKNYEKAIKYYFRAYYTFCMIGGEGSSESFKLLDMIQQVCKEIDFFQG